MEIVDLPNVFSVKCLTILALNASISDAKIVLNSCIALNFFMKMLKTKNGITSSIFCMIFFEWMISLELTLQTFVNLYNFQQAELILLFLVFLEALLLNLKKMVIFIIWQRIGGIFFILKVFNFFNHKKFCLFAMGKKLVFLQESFFFFRKKMAQIFQSFYEEGVRRPLQSVDTKFKQMWKLWIYQMF